jgi:hypothetical protein
MSWSLKTSEEEGEFLISDKGVPYVSTYSIALKHIFV